MSDDEGKLHVRLATITVGGSPIPPAERELGIPPMRRLTVTCETVDPETPAAPFWRETWFWEHVAYVLLCLLPAMVASYLSLASKGPISTRDVVLFVGSGLAQFVAQKARSAAARQAALIRRMRYAVPEVRCAPKVKRWTQAGQVLGAFLSVATAPTWWHLPSVLWALFVYDLWRGHREARKAART